MIFPSDKWWSKTAPHSKDENVHSLPNLHCNETGPKITTKSVSILCYLTMGTTGPELMYLRRSPKNGLEDNAA